MAQDIASTTKLTISRFEIEPLVCQFCGESTNQMDSSQIGDDPSNRVCDDCDSTDRGNQEVTTKYDVN